MTSSVEKPLLVSTWEAAAALILEYFSSRSPCRINFLYLDKRVPGSIKDAATGASHFAVCNFLAMKALWPCSSLDFLCKSVSQSCAPFGSLD